jgi:hypothetical protein
MKNTLDSQIDPKTIPNRGEIKKHCKNAIIQNHAVAYLRNFDNRVLNDACIWIEGYAIGATTNQSFEEPISNDEVKNFYLERVSEYVLRRILN